MSQFELKPLSWSCPELLGMQRTTILSSRQDGTLAMLSHVI